MILACSGPILSSSNLALLCTDMDYWGGPHTTMFAQAVGDLIWLNQVEFLTFNSIFCHRTEAIFMTVKSKLTCN